MSLTGALAISSDLLAQAVDQSLDGVTIADARHPDMPLVYANAGFEKITGYSATEVLGKNCRFLQGKDARQPSADVLRDAIVKGESCVAILRNFRKDGTLFWNEFHLSPVRDTSGALTHFIGVQKDVTARVEMLKNLRQSKLELQNANKQLNVLAMTDGLTGIGNRRHFNEQFHSLFALAQRNREPLAVLMLDLDFFKRFNDHYGHQNGDDSLILVAGIIADAFKRPGDGVGRYGGEEFAAVSLGMSLDEMQSYAQQLCVAVCQSAIPHAESPYGKVTVSVGGVVRIPRRDMTATVFLKAADDALYVAKQQGRNRAHIVT